MRKITICEKSCRGCGCCVRACPRGVLRLGKKKAEAGEVCIGCGECVRACPFDAIIQQKSDAEE